MHELWKDTKVRIVAAVFLLSVLVRFPALNHPSEVIFDEVHFGKFVSAYCCTNAHFFDIHPPGAKLLIAGAVAALSDYDGSQKFEKISEPYGDVSPWPFRIVPALFG